jgi:16S rRNA U516 pseudouridylate synthase RsuA-like enzyme
MASERLNRYISLAAGVSRRTADELIRQGRVTVRGRIALDPGAFLDPGADDVRLDGNTLVPLREEMYLMAWPDNVVSTMKDRRAADRGVPRATLPPVFPVGAWTTTDGIDPYHQRRGSRLQTHHPGSASRRPTSQS